MLACGSSARRVACGMWCVLPERPGLPAQHLAELAQLKALFPSVVWAPRRPNISQLQTHARLAGTAEAWACQ